MPITLNHSNISVQYSGDKSYIIETVKSDLYRKNEIIDTITRDNIQTAPVTPSIYIENGTNNVYAVESYTYSGTANTADFTRVFTKSTTCDILVVGGGGAGGNFGGGGGGGDVIYMTTSLPIGTYSISVGAGGTRNEGTNLSGNNGNNSSISGSGISTIAAAGGGGGAGHQQNARVAPSIGTSSGGGGGGSGGFQTGAVSQYSGAGGNGTTELTPGGGGGGSVGAGGTSTIKSKAGNGGIGNDISITGTSQQYGGGGGGGNWAGEFTQIAPNIGGGTGVYGGGNGAYTSASVGFVGTPGTPNTGGGGGGGGGVYAIGYPGGSGIVIIRYLLGTIPATNYLTNEPVVIAPAFTETIRSFTHSGGTEAQTTHTITVGQNTICDILIVGGGGGGGYYTGGGGGAGGYYYQTNVTIPAGNYTISVGKGGNAGPDNNTRGSNGDDTTFFGITAKGGGGGASDNAPSGNSGGSGGGADWNGTAGLDTDTNTEGNNGGTPINIVGEYYGSGGGGAGSTGFTNGNGGAGKSNSITGTNTFYAAGGGGGRNQGTNWSGIGGSSIGGNGGNGTTAGTAGLNGTGSGGGGGGFITGGSAGKGGSGIVIIKFKSLVGAGIPDGTTHKRLNFAFNQGIEGNIIAYYNFNNNANLGLDSNPYNTKYNLTPTIVGGTGGYNTSISAIGASFQATNDGDYLEGDFPLKSIYDNSTSGISISCWFYRKSGTTYDNIYNTALYRFFNSSDTAISIVVAIGHMNNSINVSCDYISGGQTFANGNLAGTINVDTWYHLVYIITKSGNLKVYVNGTNLNLVPGSADGTIRWYGTSTYPVPTFPNVNKLNIFNSASAGAKFSGNVDEFYVFNKELLQDEVTSLYNKTYSAPLNTYTLNFPVPTIADINNNSNIVLRGAYDIALSTTNAIITPKTGQYIPKPTTFVSDLLSIRYNILNPLNDPTGAQWAYSSNNTNMCHIGSVGIGTTNPEYQLDVSGSVNAKSYYLNGRQINEPLSELGLSEGMIAQVRHLTYTQMDIKNNTGWDAINDNLTTGFVIAITPKSNLSKILLNIIVHIGLTASNSLWWGIKLYRKIGAGDWTEVTGPNGTETGSAAATAGTPVWISYTMYAGDLDYQYKVTNVTGTYLDSPNTTSTVYYTAYWNNRIGDNPSASGYLYLNRAESHGDAYRPAPSSSWTASEIWYGPSI